MVTPETNENIATDTTQPIERTEAQSAGLPLRADNPEEIDVAALIASSTVKEISKEPIAELYVITLERKNGEIVQMVTTWHQDEGWFTETTVDAEGSSDVMLVSQDDVTGCAVADAFDAEEQRRAANTSNVTASLTAHLR